MRSVKSLLLSLILALMIPTFAMAQEAVEKKSESVKVFFRQGQSTIDPNYMGNGESLTRLAAIIQAYLEQNQMAQGGVGIVASASPEGSSQINVKLVNARAKAISDYMAKKCGTNIGCEIEWVGIDWNQLIEKVEANENVPYRDEVLNILRNTPEKVTINGKTINERNRQIEKLRGGVPYRWLLKNIYPTLRYAAVRTDIVYALELTLTSPSTTSYTPEGGKGEITFDKTLNDNVAPKVNCNAQWIEKIKPTANNVTYNVAANTVAEARQAVITLDYYGTAHEVTIAQEAAEPTLTIPASESITIEAEGGSSVIAYQTNVPNAEPAIATSDSEWVKVLGVEDGKITIEVAANMVTEARSAVVKVACCGKEAYVSIRQKRATHAVVVADVEGVKSSLEKRNSVMIYFRQGSSKIDLGYMNNGDNLNRLADMLEEYIVDDAKVKGRVRINSSASPEGTSQINTRLVNARAKAIADWMSRKFNTKLTYEIDTKAIDWPLLLTLVEQNEDVPYRDEVIDIIKNTPEKVTRKGVVINERERKIERLHGGVAYRWLLKNIYPQLRYAAVDTYIMYARSIVITSANPESFTAEGGQKSITFTKNVDDKVSPNVTCTADWVKDITSTPTEVTYTVAPNTLAEPRFTVVSVECYGTAHDVVINQEAAEPVLIVNQEGPVSHSNEGGKSTITYSHNVPGKTITPDVFTPAEWIKDVTVTENNEILFTVEPNEVAEERTAVVTVDSFGKAQEIVVTQAAAEPKLTITSESTINAPADGGGYTVTYKTNIPGADTATVSSSAKWITGITASKEDVSFTVEPSRKQESRTDTLAVECNGLREEVIVNQEAYVCTSPLMMSLQTNGLYDLALIPNIGAEIHLGRNWSIDANWHYAWWKIEKQNFFWRTYGGDISLRKWFGKAAKEKPLTGHHLGLYGQIITYDFELGKMGYLADRWSYAAGVEYGYSLPLAERLNLDFTLGVGYHWGEFYEYLPIDGHYVWQATKRRQYIGPTKCEISLVWLIGCNNKNKEKGGNR